MFRFFKKRKTTKEQAARIYDILRAQARQPVFYETYGVADDVTGRFEMLALHGFIVWDRLQKAEEYDLAQALFDHMFRDMERALREMGVGDLSVPRHMKRLMTGFKGRALAYRAALDGGQAVLEEALRRNLYAAADVPDDHVQAVADYVRANITQLAAQDVDRVCAGDINFICLGER